MTIERTILSILWNSLETSSTGNIISSFYALPDTGKGGLEIIGANLFRVDDKLANDWADSVSYRDFCNPKHQRRDLGGDERIEQRFHHFLQDTDSIDHAKYNFKRVLQFVIEGEDAVSRVVRLVGDIRQRRGDTVFGKFGDYQTTSDGRITYIKFPVYAPSSASQAEHQIGLFWLEHHSLGGINQHVLRGCQDYGQTVVLIKPHAFHTYDYDARWGDILDRFSRANSSTIAAKVFTFTRAQLDQFYSSKAHEPWYEQEFVPQMTRGRTLAILYEGPNIQRAIREALLEVVRPEFQDKYDPGKTAAHASDPKEHGSVEREKYVVGFDDNLLPL
ncbi:MAG: nucleoside-diphosphate kinase [Nanoarchaeota archaeon]|nr:nucleoside-diphosphate kinase [Nanoarchaeota archaeon]MBU1005033.1 nucleoside-diphosphate kinase [Nanoarchaeota archaeon]MBU1945702.1 nucleoside-diphosphate kinase [Nanoarchaeota archaeon]